MNRSRKMRLSLKYVGLTATLLSASSIAEVAVQDFRGSQSQSVSFSDIASTILQAGEDSVLVDPESVQMASITHRTVGEKRVKPVRAIQLRSPKISRVSARELPEEIRGQKNTYEPYKGRRLWTASSTLNRCDHGTWLSRGSAHTPRPSILQSKGKKRLVGCECTTAENGQLVAVKVFATGLPPRGCTSVSRAKVGVTTEVVETCPCDRGRGG